MSRMIRAAGRLVSDFDCQGFTVALAHEVSELSTIWGSLGRNWQGGGT